jgi:hypothetical protein
MRFALLGLVAALAAYCTLHAWLKPTPPQNRKASLPAVMLGAGVSFISLLVVLNGPRWAAVAIAALAGLYPAWYFGRLLFPRADNRPPYVRAGMFALLAIQAAGFACFLVSMVLIVPREGAT